MPKNGAPSSSRPRSRSSNSVCCAVVGAGPFADAYAPLLQCVLSSRALVAVNWLFERDVVVRYVWSRSAESSKAIIGTMEPVMQKARAMCGEAGFAAILDDPRVEAVVLVLPPSVALEYVIRILAAGKCVLSEKPLAGTIADARACIRAHRKVQANFKLPPVWFVAENFRFEEAFVEAARIMPRLGFLLKLDLVADTPLNARYYVSAWCRNQSPGGFLIDMSVHHMAALRLVAEAANSGKALSVKASTRDSGTGLAAPDCADATVTWNSGLVSCLSICMVASQLQYRLSATGVSGSLEITRVDWDQYKLKYKLRGDRRSTSRLFRVAGVQNEFQSFLNLVGDWKSGAPPDAKVDMPPAPATPSPPRRRNRFEEEPVVSEPDNLPGPSKGKEKGEKLPEWRGRPEEGFRDLALAAAIIESGETGKTTKVPDL